MALSKKAKNLTAAGEDRQGLFKSLLKTCMTPQQCRRTIGTLADGEVKRPCKRQRTAYPESFHCLRHLSLSCIDESMISIPYMHFPSLLQKKVEACPAYKDVLQRCAREHRQGLTLVVYGDEATVGNPLHPDPTRKGMLVYAIFAEMPNMFDTHMWLTLSLQRTEELHQIDNGYALVFSRLLEQLRLDTENGICIDWSADEDSSLIFIRKVLVLADHENIWKCTGAKGHAGIKPCC